MVETETTLISALATTGSISAVFTGDTVMAWAMLAINILTLASNTALAIYRNWRNTLEGKEEDPDDNENEHH